MRKTLHKQTDKQTNRHYENNSHLAVNQLTEADKLTIRLGATPSELTSAHLHHPPHIFHRPDALPAAQPCQSTDGNKMEQDSWKDTVTNMEWTYCKE